MTYEKAGLIIDQLQSQGRYSFTREELLRISGQSIPATRRALERQQEKGRIARITGSFYVIIPLEYRQSKILPAEWFVDNYLRHLGMDYYVGLLSAAAMHGAAHQRPQEFQILIKKQRRMIVVRGLRLRFIFKKHLDTSYGVVSIKTETGILRASGAELTALDLLKYPRAIGGLDRIVTILVELAEKIEPDILLEVSQKEHVFAHIQRLGYLLDRIGFETKTKRLSRWLTVEKPLPAFLDPSRKKDHSPPFNKKWQLYENQTIEMDSL